jgi:hypothetical protein
MSIYLNVVRGRGLHFVRVGMKLCRFETGAQTEGVCEQGAEDIWRKLYYEDLQKLFLEWRDQGK